MTSPFSTTSNASRMSWADYTKFQFLHGYSVEPCVFEVPKTLSDTKLDAYAPQKVGLGPYHHLRPDLQHMTGKKYDGVKAYLCIEDVTIEDVIYMLDQWPADLEAKIRRFYGRSIDLDRKSLGWITTIDVIFLLYFIQTFNRREDFDHKVYDGSPFSSPPPFKIDLLVPDIMMLENQIPLLLIREMRFFFPEMDIFPLDAELAGEVLRFCSRICPFEIAGNSYGLTDSAFHPPKHVLHVMYLLSLGTYMAGYSGKKEEHSAEKNDCHDDKGRLAQHLVAVTRFVMSRAKGIVGFAVGQVASAFGIAKSGGVQMSEKVDKMFTAAGNIQKILSSDTKIDQQRSLLPSVSELSDVVQTTFHLSDNPGIRGTHFDKSRNEFSLPGMRLQENSEVILRNLLAYEASLPDEVPKEIANFVSFLSTMIIAEKDVKILSDAQIIKGKLSENEVVVLFNSLKTSITASGVLERNKKSNSSLDDFGSQLRQQFINNPVVKACSRTTNCCVFFFNSLTPLVPMFVVLLLLFQSFCEIYDCRRSSPSASSQAYYPFTDSSFLSFNTTSDLAELISARKILRYSS